MAADPRCPPEVLDRVLSTQTAHDLAQTANLTMNDLRTDLSEVVLIALDGVRDGRTYDEVLALAMASSTAHGIRHLTRRENSWISRRMECFIAVALQGADELVAC